MGFLNTLKTMYIFQATKIKINNIKSTQSKKFKNIYTQYHHLLSKRELFGFSILVSSKQSLSGHTCIENALEIFNGQFQKLIKSIIF